MTSLNIVFAGTPEFGLPCLEHLLHSAHTLQAIYTQPDRPAGRGRKLQASAVKEWALIHQIPVYQPLNFKNPETIAELAALKPDVLVVIAYGLILPKAVLEIPKFGCINVHASLLPLWRGASPIQSAILHGDKESGVTIMRMDVGMDTGAMFHKVSCPITSVETAKSLHDKLAQIAPPPLLKTLEELADHKAHSEPQNEALVTYAAKISKEEALIDWKQTAQELDRKIRAFNPWPIAYTQLGDQNLRIHQAKVVELHCPEKPGTVMQIDKQGILVTTSHHALLLEKIQFPGANVISVSDWFNTPKSQIHVGLSFNE